MTEPTRPARGDTPDEVVPMEVVVPARVVLRWGLVLWAVALVVVVAVPDLRSGERSWWVWVPVTAVVLGALGYVYVRRGRGNATGA